jgi:hypothetical protein
MGGLADTARSLLLALAAFLLAGAFFEFTRSGQYCSTGDSTEAVCLQRNEVRAERAVGLGVVGTGFGLLAVGVAIGGAANYRKRYVYPSQQAAYPYPAAPPPPYPAPSYPQQR